jgi:hypothetical protein
MCNNRIALQALQEEKAREIDVNISIWLKPPCLGSSYVIAAGGGIP